MIVTHSLPAATRARVARSLRGLRQFPRMGARLDGRWDRFRFVLGPWRWLLLVYVYLESEDRVVIVTVQDARTMGPRDEDGHDPDNDKSPAVRGLCV